MCTRLCIQVSSAPQAPRLEVEFFYADTWTADAEAVLLQRVHELLALVRPDGKSLTLHLDLEVADPGEAVFQIKKRLNGQIHRKVEQQKLSIRELEILDLIMQGHTNNEIAARLFISYETVKSHRKHILAKTGAKNTAALISYYHQAFFEK